MSNPNEELSGRLLESEQRYRAVIENASDMIQSCRPDGSFEFVNPAWLEKLEYAPEELEQLTIWDVIHPDSLDHCRQIFAQAAIGIAIEHVQATFISKYGRALPVEGSATSRLVDGRVIATHSFFRDVTERLHAEELKQRNAELEREQLARRLEKMAALGKLSAGLAHELNNPAAAAQRAAAQLNLQLPALAVLTLRLHRHNLPETDTARLLHFGQLGSPHPAQDIGALERSDLEEAVAAWLDEHGVDEAWRLAPELVSAGFSLDSLNALAGSLPPVAIEDAVQWVSQSRSVSELVQIINTSANSISGLVNAIREYSYMDRAPVQDVDVHDGIESTLRILAHKLKQGVRLRREYDRGLPKVTVPAGELNQVWTNLLDNAIDAAGPAGEVTIRTSSEDEQLVVEVADNGPGIPAAIQSRIFDPFFTTKDVGQGTGLGLDVARRIVTQQCGGTIDFRSRAGDTRFLVRLPLYEAGRATTHDTNNTGEDTER